MVDSPESRLLDKTNRYPETGRSDRRPLERVAARLPVVSSDGD